MLGLPDGYQRQEPAPFDDWSAADGKVWQPDVYPLAAETAAARGVRCVVDLGCGTGAKLLDMAGDFDVIGVDTPATIERCRQAHPDGTWIAHDLDDVAAPLPDLPDDALIVCSDVIEHLWRPDRLMAALVASGCTVVLSTPDRNLTHGPGHMGPPPNPAHAQEWTLGELCEWIGALGGKITGSGHTRSHDGTDAAQTCLVVIR